MNEIISITAHPINGQEVQTVNARELHGFLEVRKDFSDWIKDQLEVFTQGIDYLFFPPKGENNNMLYQHETRGRPRTEYAITIECAKHIAMMSRTEKGRQARDYFIECERRAKAALPALPSNLREALLLAADLEAKREEAEARAMEAERTKTWIGSKREATAMATASAEHRRAEKLAIELDKSMEYAAVKRMQLLYHGQKFDWRRLKSTATEMDIPPIDVFDQNYGTVKAYHKDVWREAYALDIPA